MWLAEFEDQRWDAGICFVWETDVVCSLCDDHEVLETTGAAVKHGAGVGVGKEFDANGFSFQFEILPWRELCWGGNVQTEWDVEVCFFCKTDFMHDLFDEH